MTTVKPSLRKTPYATPDEVAARHAVIERAIRQHGDRIDELESALGMYLVGFHYGWKVLQLIHSKKTIAKYERMLGIRIRDTFAEYGPDADLTNAYRIIQAGSNYWKLVSGDEKSPLPLDKRALAS